MTYDRTDNFILIMNQTEFREFDNQKQIISVTDNERRPKFSSLSLADSVFNNMKKIVEFFNVN